ncbi:MAG: long-chain fatty acid--CoA ligase, partial [Deltaproteobacteria bacterium]|nr:long-chain fatty acid--CoA ligase [Deltaproteobacteria bacterium]
MLHCSIARQQEEAVWENASLVDHARRWAAYTPDRVALTGPDGAVTWRRLDRDADAWSSRLAAQLGVAPGDRVALLARNHPDFFALFFACRRVGATLAPLNWRLAVPELDALLELARPKVLLHDDAFRDTAGKLRLPGGCGMAAVSSPLPTSPEIRAAAVRSPHPAPALLLFTSGTTGRPKAAMIPDRQIFFNGINTILAWQLTGADETLLFTPLFHTGALNVLALPLLQAGGTVHVHDAFCAPAVVDAIASGSVSVLFGVPVIFRMLAQTPGFFEAARDRVPGTRDLSPHAPGPATHATGIASRAGSAPGRSRLRLCLGGGAPLPLALIREYERSGLTLTQGFGMTEAGPNCFFLPPDQALSRAGSVGTAMPYCDARIARKDGSPAAPGEVGELWMRGPHV